MTQTQIMNRIKKMKADACITWAVPDKNICPGCGETFRCVCNLKKHIKRCLDCCTYGETQTTD